MSARRQAIIWSNDGQGWWRIYASLGLKFFQLCNIGNTLPIFFRRNSCYMYFSYMFIVFFNISQMNSASCQIKGPLHYSIESNEPMSSKGMVNTHRHVIYYSIHAFICFGVAILCTHTETHYNCNCFNTGIYCYKDMASTKFPWSTPM